MLRVRLNPDERRWAKRIGTERQETALGDPSYEYRDRTGLITHQLGALGELAFARAMGFEWLARVGVGRRLPDLDPFWEVRWSSSVNRVKAKTNDDPCLMIVHVTGDEPDYVIWGFIWAKWMLENTPAIDLPDREGNPRNRPAHFAKPSVLTPIDEDSHTICHWLKFKGEGCNQTCRERYGDQWVCLFCGALFEQGTSSPASATAVSVTAR